MSGCGAAPRNYPGPPSCIVGSGVFAFIPFGDRASIPIIMGPQGGYHIWGSSLIRYMNQSGTTQRYTMSVAATGMVVQTNSYSDALAEVDPTTLPDGGDTGVAVTQDGWSESLGHRVFVLEPLKIDQVPLRMKLEASDSEGRKCTDERDFTPHRLTIPGGDGGVLDM